MKPLKGEIVTGSEGQNFESYQLRKWRRSFPIAGIPAD